MRRGFFLFLMVLLVLRGLTSTAMAAGMVPPMGAAPHPAQALGHAAVAAHHGHNHDPGQQEEHGGAMSHPGGQTLHTAPAPCDAGSAPACDGGPAHHAGVCTACEICHSAALTPPALASPLLNAAAHVVSGVSAQFDSAPVSRTVKPPIS